MADVLALFGQRVRELRLARSMTQQELANRAKVHRSYIGEIELGRRNASLLTIYKISLALDVQLIVLLKFPSE